ncbi:hypothetical protein HCTV5_83 [Halovirus HCTV-5]|nr:hypothetical protein M200_gp142 [Halovirus HCTV-5]AGM11692.1 hypothetical protein HCTV5_83 [Halovirus HCTV-5]
MVNADEVIPVVWNLQRGKTILYRGYFLVTGIWTDGEIHARSYVN